MALRRTVLKILILISTGYALVRMLHWTIGFTYFTQLSNLYVAVVVLIQLLDGKKHCVLKYSAAGSIFITFLIYLLVLAPAMPGGMIAAYRQDHYASLCLHLITPALTVADFFLHDTGYQWEKKHIFSAVIPPVVYLCFILLLGGFGFRWGRGSMTGPYAFLNYAAPAGWLGFRPETASYTTLGIGVFYCIMILVLLFLLVGGLFLALAKRRSIRFS